jgi:hypothetical protein
MAVFSVAAATESGLRQNRTTPKRSSHGRSLESRVVELWATRSCSMRGFDINWRRPGPESKWTIPRQPVTTRSTPDRHRCARLGRSSLLCVCILSVVAAAVMVRSPPSTLAACGLWFASSAFSAALPARDTAPVVTVKNGSYSGIYSSEYDQDFFLGMPYAQVCAIL